MSRRNRILLILAILIAVDVAAFMAFPPTDPKNPDVCTYPVCFINGNLELPAPHAVFPPGHHAPEGLIVFDVSISSTLLTMWVVAALVILAFWALSRGRKMIPGRGQNVVEWIYESVESFGMSIAEALACGVPVVAYRVGGIPEVVGDCPAAELVELGDTCGMAAAALRMLDRAGREPELGALARRRILDHFTPERIVPQYEALYRRLVAGRAPQTAGVGL